MATAYVFILRPSCDFFFGHSEIGRAKAVRRLRGNRAVVVRPPQPPHGNCMKPVQLPFRGCAEIVRLLAVIVQVFSVCRPKVYVFTFLFGL